MTDNGSKPQSAAGLLPRDGSVALVILVFCAATYWVTFSFPKVPAALAQNIQPATFPRLVLSVMAVLAAIILARSFMTPQKAFIRVPALVPMSAAVMVAFVAAFQLLGILPAMVLLCVALPLLWGERRILAILVFAIVLPAAIYGLFSGLLSVHFEPGSLLSR